MPHRIVLPKGRVALVDLVPFNARTIPAKRTVKRVIFLQLVHFPGNGRPVGFCSLLLPNDTLLVGMTTTRIRMWPKHRQKFWVPVSTFPCSYEKTKKAAH